MRQYFWSKSTGFYKNKFIYWKLVLKYSFVIRECIQANILFYNEIFMKKTIYKKEIVIDNNIVSFEFNNPSKEEWNISENFDFINKPFVFTIWVCEIIKIDELDETLKEINIKNIIKQIITIVYEKARVDNLDYLQRLSINNEKCWIIDNWCDICLLLPNEY